MRYRLSRRWFIALLTVTGVLVLAASVWAIIRRPGAIPDPTKQNSQQIAKYVASEDFGRHDEKSRDAYLKKVRELYPVNNRALWGQVELTDKERETLRKNIGPVFRQAMQERIDGYFNAPAEQRTAYLDKMIDDMRGFAGNGPRPGAGRGFGGRFTPKRLGQMIDHTDAKQRARMTEFMEAMRTRLQQRGIAPPGGR